jgi:hypothetical protein
MTAAAARRGIREHDDGTIGMSGIFGRVDTARGLIRAGVQIDEDALAALAR